MFEADHMSIDKFEPLLNQAFRIQLQDGENVELVLAETESRGSASIGERKGFSLLFAGPKTAMLQQQIYALQNDSLGTVSIFLVPVGAKGDLILYEAVFN